MIDEEKVIGMKRYIKTIEGKYTINHCGECPIIGCADMINGLSETGKRKMDIDVLESFRNETLNHDCPLPVELDGEEPRTIDRDGVR